MTTDPERPRDEGLMASLQRLGHGLVRVLVTRFEILSTEVAEERFNLTKLALVALVILFCLQVGLMLGLLFVVLVVGTEHRVAAIGIAALVMLLGAGGGTLWLRGWLKSRPPMFAATVAELRKDRDRFRREP
jgi:uncharacterized membrane protein YqjE